MVGTRNLHMLALSLLLVVAGYYAGAIVGISLGFPPAGIAAIWPSTAILLAALLLAPPRYWVMYLLGVVPAHWHVVASFQLPQVPLVVTLAQVGSNILLALLAALSLRSLTGAPPRFGSLRNMGAFILLAGVLATAVACLVAVSLFLLTGWTTNFWIAWRQRMLANVFAIVTIPPVVVLAFAGELVGARHATWRSYVELVLVTIGVIVVGVPTFGLEPPGPTVVPALLLAPLPFLIWAAVRLGVGGTSLTLLVVAGVALASAYVGRGPFIHQAPDVNVLSLQIFLTAICIPVLLLAAVVDERRQAAESLKQTNEQAELALADREAQLGLAGQAAGVGSFAIDIPTGRVRNSPGYATIHGLPEGIDEFPWEEWRSRVHPDDLARVDTLRSKAFSERRREHKTEYRIVGADGRVQWIESRGLISYDDAGHPTRLVGVNIDITERKQSQAALEESEARYRSLYDDNPSMYFTVDASGTVLSVNEFGARQLGYTPAELVGRSVLEMIHEGDRAKAGRWLASCAESAGAISRAEMRKVRRDGSILWVRKLARAVDSFGGQTLFIVCEDVTERKQAELALAEREAQLGLAGQAARVGSFVIDFATGQIQTSPGFAAIHGLAEESEGLTCEKWRACVFPDDLAHFEALRSRTLAEQRRELNMEYRVVGADGEARWIESRGLVSYDGEGCPTRLVGVHIDITERKRAEEHLQAMNAELDHRVKNVLATASAVASQTLNASSSSEQFVSAFDGRLRSMAQTHELLSERLWRGIPLGELLRRELEPYSRGSNSEIGGPEVILTAEAGQTLEMVFHELSTNAAKHGAFSSREGRVSVEWRRQWNGDASAGLVIDWRETGGPPTKAECKTGYGTSVICELIPHELAGKVSHVLTPGGARCQLEIPGRWIDATTAS
jgi:PAS domain S-box-containing protein